MRDSTLCCYISHVRIYATRIDTTDVDLEEMDHTALFLPHGGEVEEDYAPARSWSDLKRVVCTESAKMWLIAAPVGFNVICQYGLSSVTNIFAGHIGEIELSAVSISLSVICTFSFGFRLGMGSALETLCGQEFGAGQVHMLGVYMQRSWITYTFTYPQQHFEKQRKQTYKEKHFQKQRNQTYKEKHFEKQRNFNTRTTNPF